MGRSVYTHLQLAGFRIRTDRPWEREMYVLRFPEEWKKPLSALARTPRDGTEVRPIPIARLNRILRAVVQDVIAVATKATVGDRPPWLYDDVKVDPEVLIAIVGAWIRASHNDAGLTASI